MTCTDYSVFERELKKDMHVIVLTSCAMAKAPSNSSPGRSKKDQLRDRVTKMRAWLTILTCRYKAAINSSGLSLMDLTLNFSCRKMKILNYFEESFFKP